MILPKFAMAIRFCLFCVDALTARRSKYDFWIPDKISSRYRCPDFVLTPSELGDELFEVEKVLKSSIFDDLLRISFINYKGNS